MSHPDLGQIIGVTTHKQLGSASGTFTITIKKNPQLRGRGSTQKGGPRSALRDLWRDPEDVWVRIKFVVDGQVIDTMLGMIDTVREDTTRSGMGARSETYTIHGRDFGKVFETTEIFVNLLVNTDSVVARQADVANAFLDNIRGTPEYFVRLLIDTWIGNNRISEQPWDLPGSLGTGGVIALLSNAQGVIRGIQSMKIRNSGFCVAPNLLQFDQNGGKLWDVLQEYSNGLLNELFVDLGPNSGKPRGALENLQPTVYLRERPFPTHSTDGSRKWDGLLTRILELGDVQHRDIAKGGGAHRFNYWDIQLSGLGNDRYNIAEILQRGIEGVKKGRPGNIPIFSPASISRHGLRRHHASTRFIPHWEETSDVQVAENNESFIRLAATWLKKVHDWYSVAPLELSGEITTSRIMPEIRIGERVREQRLEGEITYYCEGVRNTWTYPNAGSSGLTLTRGEYEGDDLLEIIYEEYERPRALTGREAAFFPVDTKLSEVKDPLAQDTALEVGTEETAATTKQRTLEIERDGTQPRTGDPDAPAIDNPGMNRTLDDTEPTVGDDPDVLPPAVPTDSRPGKPTLDKQALERGEPIDVNDDLSFEEDDL